MRVYGYLLVGVALAVLDHPFREHLQTLSARTISVLVLTQPGRLGMSQESVPLTSGCTRESRAGLKAGTHSTLPNSVRLISTERPTLAILNRRLYSFRVQVKRQVLLQALVALLRQQCDILNSEQDTRNLHSSDALGKGDAYVRL